MPKIILFAKYMVVFIDNRLVSPAALVNIFTKAAKKEPDSGLRGLSGSFGSFQASLAAHQGGHFLYALQREGRLA